MPLNCGFFASSTSKIFGERKLIGMQMSQVYLVVGFAAFLLLVIMVFFTRNKRAQLSAASLTAFVLVLAGMTLGEDNLAGYSFPTLAVVVSIVDVLKDKGFHRR